MQIVFLPLDNAGLLFLHLESLIKFFVFSQFDLIFEILGEHISFSLIYKIFRAIAVLFFSTVFQSFIFDGKYFSSHSYLFINGLIFETLSEFQLIFT